MHGWISSGQILFSLDLDGSCRGDYDQMAQWTVQINWYDLRTLHTYAVQEARSISHGGCSSELQRHTCPKIGEVCVRHCSSTCDGPLGTVLTS